LTYRLGVNVISLQQVKISFGGVSVLNDITFSVEAGERVSLLGPGGCGKSTVLKILFGLLAPDEGEVMLMDTPMRTASEEAKQATLRKVGMAFQQGALFDFMTVRENLLFAMENMTDLDRAAMEARLKKLLDGVKLGRTENMFPFELSGGMQRRVGIARALCTDPVVAIFDEPTAGLDPVTSTIILNMILELAGGNDDRAQMVVTSNVEIGIRFADRVIVINEGRVVADGPWRELLVSGPQWVRHFLGVRFIGLDLEYAHELKLPEAFIAQHW
jgi:phospholipid/cholesterol/gamma-HCH transport system ATP-binding protein